MSPLIAKRARTIAIVPIMSNAPATSSKSVAINHRTSLNRQNGMSSSMQSSMQSFHSDDDTGRGIYDGGGARGNPLSYSATIFQGNHNDTMHGKEGSSQMYRDSSSPEYNTTGSAFQPSLYSGPNNMMSGNSSLISRQGFSQSRAMDPYGGGVAIGSSMGNNVMSATSASNSSMNPMYDYNTGATYGSFPANMLQRDPHYQPQQINEYGMMGQTYSSTTDQPMPTSLSDYYMAQQQQQFNAASQQANFFGLMSSPPSSGMYEHLTSAPTRTSKAPPVPTKPKKRRAKTFPEKLMKVLTEHANEDAIAWLPDGKSFVVVHSDIFVKTVLNKGFKASKYASFVRKLHRWGFVRLTSGTGTDCFHHPLFVRGDMEQVSQISCAPPSGRVADKPPSLVGVERFIRTKVAEAASKTLHNGMDMRSEDGGRGHESSKALGEQNLALVNSSSVPTKDIIDWEKPVQYDRECAASMDNRTDNCQEKTTPKSVEKELSQEVDSGGSGGEFSPHPLQPRQKIQTKFGDGPQVGLFFNASQDAKPSGLDELANVAFGLREQSMPSVAP